ncbi:hypothetical protein Nmel_009790 [Mimus melanotis]
MLQLKRREHEHSHNSCLIFTLSICVIQAWER